MTSPRDTKFLQESGEHSEETSSNLGASTRSTTPNVARYSANEFSDFTASSPPVLEPSKDESRSVDGRWNRTLFKRLLTRSLRLSPSETVPIVSGDQSNERDAEQQMNGQVEESGTNCCTKAINCYKNSVTKFRNSAFMYIVQLVFSSIPVSAIVMGLLFAENCPKVHFLPVFGAVIGIFGAIFMGVWMVVSCSNRRGTPCSNRQKFLFGVLCFLLSIFTIINAVFVGFLSPSFDPTSTEYCNETFYTYAFYKEIATAAVIVLSAILYLPGSRHILCCHNCSMRSTPNAFYYSI
ncbi:hypothetical protein AVEN_129265-1 [Araneus ventricosus]|uniref:Uncharacterized protein n=1 Tax=Araneus ventricosus TaxID=182803 RepID=A0A4Y2HM99_ARAVE|nr:hypothetical protein AVEN_129265-1 [Araneus ventricosus]